MRNGLQLSVYIVSVSEALWFHVLVDMSGLQYQAKANNMPHTVYLTGTLDRHAWHSMLKLRYLGNMETSRGDKGKKKGERDLEVQYEMDVAYID